MTITLEQAKPKFLLSGEGDSYQMLTHTIVRKITGDDTKGQYVMFEASDTAENGAPVHSHPWEETFYILEGEVEVRVGERQAIATPGSVCHIPADTVHTFKVKSAIARFLVIISPASAEAFYQELAAKVTSLPPDPNVFQSICDKHGLHLQ
jgi:quercetin dioxygenase-like cupin family protein